MTKGYLYSLQHSRKVVKLFFRSIPRVLHFLVTLYNFTQDNAIEVYRTDQKRWRDLKKVCWYVYFRLQTPREMVSSDAEAMLTRSFPRSWTITLKKQIKRYMDKQPPIVKVKKIRNFGRQQL